MKRWIAIVLVAAMCAGCSHVHPADPTSGASTVERVNRAVGGRTVEVRLQNGGILWAENVRVAADSTWLSVVGRPSYVRQWQVDVGRGLQSSDVETVSMRRRGRGALEGAALGLLAGVLAGLIMGAEDSWVDASDAAVIIGRIGLGVGLLYGGIMGSRDVYDFTRTPRE